MHQGADPSGRDFWQEWLDYTRQKESEYERWQEEYRQWEESQRLEEQRQADAQQEQQRLDDQRRQNEQKQLNDQRREQRTKTAERQEERRESKQLESQRDLSTLERAMYANWNQKLREETAFSDYKQGLDRHDFYNIDTAHELESAMGRAASQGVDYHSEKKFQQFLDREAEQGIGQAEGKRPLNDRYQELRQRRDEAVSLMRRNVPSDMIPSMKLYESNWEQQHRLGKEQQAFQENMQWVQGGEKRIQHRQQQRAQTQEKSSARERLEQIRAANGITDQTQNQQQRAQGKDR